VENTLFFSQWGAGPKEYKTMKALFFAAKKEFVSEGNPAVKWAPLEVPFPEWPAPGEPLRRTHGVTPKTLSLRDRVKGPKPGQKPGLKTPEKK